ncbi:hypothetical protein ANCDUO_11532 [Ancylostoma duodenale]|uniref:Uncharacterized protein n=1 Tax=Ancylostoma duodenale TaxID=51022 RepID=A0A0C2GHC0_9BILA|nr:hypothetical protein ANCDUO_11532 [Ancylostoma duodenale]
MRITKEDSGRGPFKLQEVHELSSAQKGNRPTRSSPGNTSEVVGPGTCRESKVDISTRFRSLSHGTVYPKVAPEQGARIRILNAMAGQLS